MANFFAVLATIFAGWLILLVLYMLFVMLPVAFYADAKCKAAGYPRGEVTILLDSYCMNLDGSVTVKVEKLK